MLTPPEINTETKKVVTINFILNNFFSFMVDNWTTQGWCQFQVAIIPQKMISYLDELSKKAGKLSRMMCLTRSF